MIEEKEIRDRLFNLSDYSYSILRDYNLKPKLKKDANQILDELIEILKLETSNFEKEFKKFVLLKEYLKVIDEDTGIIFNKKIIRECIILTIYKDDEETLNLLERYKKINDSEITRRDRFTTARMTIATKNITRKLNLKK